MGVSFSRYPDDVSTVLWNALPRTLVLFLSATLFAFWLGFKAGKFIAWRRGAVAEQGMITAGIFLQTVFYPWFAILMLWLFGFYLGVVPDRPLHHRRPVAGIGLHRERDLPADDPLGGHRVRALWDREVVDRTLFPQPRLPDPGRTGARHRFHRRTPALLVGATGNVYVADIAHHTILPVITLGLVAFGATMLLTRSAMLETLGEDYILTARAKGIPDWIIRDRHAARNAMLPVTTSLVLALAFVIGGGIVTETIFSWPGMGLVFLQAINVSDIPLAVGALAITGVLALFGHLIADILYVILDPRIRIA